MDTCELWAMDQGKALHGRVGAAPQSGSSQSLERESRSSGLRKPAVKTAEKESALRGPWEGFGESSQLWPEVPESDVLGSEFQNWL